MTERIGKGPSTMETELSNHIGHCEFVDGSTLPVYRDAQGQYVFDSYGDKVYGVWILDPESLNDEPEPPDADPFLTAPASPEHSVRLDGA